VILRQDTRFPDEPSTRLTWTCEHPVRLTLRLRHPYWIKEELDVSINGRAVIVNSKPSSFASITRTWKSGDRVDIALPMTLRLEAMPDNPQRVAVMYGPLVLAGDLGTADDARAEQPDYVPVLLTKGRSPSSWLQAVPEQACTFRTMGVGRPRDVLLRPFFRIHERRYTVYWDIFTEAQWQAKEAAYQSELAWQQALDAKTVDFFQPGEMQPERDHKLLGEKTSAGRAMGRAWRHAVDGGWFSFAMKVDPNRTQDLICTFWGGDSGGREFDVLVNGATIVTQKLDNKRPGQFYDEVYALPAYLTQGKTGIVIKLQAHPGKTAGGLFGARIIRKEQ
jgi:hypothetical protein